LRQTKPTVLPQINTIKRDCGIEHHPAYLTRRVSAAGVKMQVARIAEYVVGPSIRIVSHLVGTKTGGMDASVPRMNSSFINAEQPCGVLVVAFRALEGFGTAGESFDTPLANLCEDNSIDGYVGRLIEH